MERSDQSIIRGLPGNDKCIDCGAAIPQWASVKFGVLFCLECSGRHRGLGVQIDFVRSVTLDSWTEDQLALMKIGGNDKCLSYFDKCGVAKDCTIREKYDSDAARQYKEILAAQVKGAPVPDFPARSTNDSSTNSDGNDDAVSDGDESLEDLVRHDQSITYSQGCGTVVSYFWNKKICRNIHPLALSAIYLSLGGVYHAVLHNAMLRATVLVVSALPVMGSLAFIGFGTRMFVNNRQAPFKSAGNLLLERIKTGRAKRTKNGFDIYLPPSKSANERTDKTFGVLFFPGALINHTAYAPIASKLSDRGIVVAVISLEPMRFSTDVESNKKKALTAMYEVLSTSDITVDEWVLSGHSAGGMVAITLAAEMKPGITKLVLCGIGTNEFGEQSFRNDSIQALVINGSEDKLVNGRSEKQKEAFQNTLPPSTTYVTIEGGNHAGFGHYGPQMMDGTRTITLDEQQDIFVNKTVEFLIRGCGSETKEK
mmetsp:Transcript_1335/g.1670  ORF Transcript_1335/g.1670 Transcript_1335/m.1670 type:complete len:482 (+) Transcript_1335:145-1590(+)